MWKNQYSRYLWRKSIAATARLSRRSYNVVKKYVRSVTIKKKQKGRPSHQAPCRNARVCRIAKKIFTQWIIVNNALPMRLVYTKVSQALGIYLNPSNLCEFLKMDHLLLWLWLYNNERHRRSGTWDKKIKSNQNFFARFANCGVSLGLSSGKCLV